MSRRWLLILCGVVALGAATVLALALSIPRGPFRFLDEENRARLLPSWQGVKGETVYCWYSDDEALMKEARAELSPIGFKEVSFSNPFKDATAFSKDQARDMVLIHRDTRISPGNPQHLVRAPGWVTVIVVLEQPPGLWDRIKAVFGL